jgi:hypothetical protein
MLSGRKDRKELLETSRTNKYNYIILGKCASHVGKENFVFDDGNAHAYQCAILWVGLR